MTTLKIYKTHPDVQLPSFATEQSACFDISFQSAGKQGYEGFNVFNKKILRPFKDGNIYINARDRVMVPTGIILDIPEGYSVRLHPRSGLSLKSGIVLANAEGVIDSDYVEELMVLIWNISDNAIQINSGDRIAQAELIKDADYSITMIATRPLPKTSRQGGMGSTGVTDNGDSITLNITEPKLPDFVKKPEPPVKRGRGRPRKDAVRS